MAGERHGHGMGTTWYVLISLYAVVIQSLSGSNPYVALNLERKSNKIFALL
jgi:hypothetical protein